MDLQRPGFKPGGLNVEFGLGLPTTVQVRKGDELRSRLEGRHGRRPSAHAVGCLLQRLREFPGDRRPPVVCGPFSFELNVPGPTKSTASKAKPKPSSGTSRWTPALGWMHSELGPLWASDRRAPIGFFFRCDASTGPSTLQAASASIWRAGIRPTRRNSRSTSAPSTRFALGDEDTLTPRINYGHVSSQWATLFENQARGDKIEARDIINAQLAWTHGEW